MKRTLALILALVPGFLPARAAPESIVGVWRYDGFFYEGQRYPLPNPDLDLTFTFDEDGKSRLYWRRVNEPGFCERIADYEVTENVLAQKVVWVNPENLPECSSDVDMQMGRESFTEFEFGDRQIGFHFELNGKPFLYILKAVEPAS